MKKYKLFFKILCTIMLVFFGVMYGYIYYAQNTAKNYYARAMAINERVYVYETYSKALNPVLYIEDLTDSSALISYYKKQENGVETPLYFPIKFMTLTLTKPIFKLGKVGENLIEVVDIDTACWGYIKGYVYMGTVHGELPNDSLIKDYREFIQHEMQSAKSEKSQSSPYGWYCKCKK